jgi:circadian clock protein KaiB
MSSVVHPVKFRMKARRSRWQLRLYVSGVSPRNQHAVANLKALCRDRLHCAYHLTVIDILKQPLMARTEQIVATPTLVRLFPKPARRLLGDLSNKERTLAALDLEPEIHENT